MDVYPERGSFYLGSFPQDRPFFQGDVFRGVPAVLAAHPAALQAGYAATPSPPSGCPTGRPPTGPEKDVYASFRRNSSVDAAHLSRANRVAVLSRPAWIVLIQRLFAFFGGVSLGYEEIAEQLAHLYVPEGG